MQLSCAARHGIAAWPRPWPACWSDCCSITVLHRASLRWPGWAPLSDAVMHMVHHSLWLHSRSLSRPATQTTEPSPMLVFLHPKQVGLVELAPKSLVLHKVQQDQRGRRVLVPSRITMLLVR